MSNYILGSGLVAFLAKHILPQYEILPFGKSRFYRYKVATCDDYVIYHDEVSEVIKSLGNDLVPVFFKRAFSMSGQLMFQQQIQFANTWLSRIGEHPDYAASLVKMDCFIYTSSGTKLFKQLEAKSIRSCCERIQKGEKVKHIDVTQRQITMESPSGRSTIPYENIISTIPLDALLALCGMDNSQMKCANLHMFLVKTKELDFEGASELLILDEHIDFIKCTQLSPTIYQFFSLIPIGNISNYLSLLMKKFEIIDGTCVNRAIPITMPPDTSALAGIQCIGSLAQWDNAVDLSTSIIRLRNLKT